MEVNQDKAQAAKACFDFNRNLYKVYVTSDMNCFGKSDDAINHARTLPEKSVDVFERDEQSGVASDDDQTAELTSEAENIPDHLLASVARQSGAAAEFQKVAKPQPEEPVVSDTPQITLSGDGTANQTGASSAPGADQATDTTAAPADQATDTTAAPADQSSDTTAAPADQSTDMTAAPADQATDTTAAPADQSSDTTAAPADQSTDTTAAPADQATDTTAAPADQATDATAAPAENITDKLSHIVDEVEELIGLNKNQAQ